MRFLPRRTENLGLKNETLVRWQRFQNKTYAQRVEERPAQRGQFLTLCVGITGRITGTCIETTPSVARENRLTGTRINISLVH